MSRQEHIRTTHYHVDHLHFEHCDLGLERQLEKFPGVVHVAVNVRSGLVAIDFDERRVTKARLERTICDCGYDCRCAEPPTHETV